MGNVRRIKDNERQCSVCGDVVTIEQVGQFEVRFVGAGSMIFGTVLICEDCIEMYRPKKDKQAEGEDKSS